MEKCPTEWPVLHVGGRHPWLHCDDLDVDAGRRDVRKAPELVGERVLVPVNDSKCLPLAKPTGEFVPKRRRD